MSQYVKITGNIGEAFYKIEHPPASMDQSEYVKNGYLPYTEEKLPPKDGFIIVEDRFEISDNAVILKYKYAEKPVMARTFSKYMIMEALIKADQWKSVKSILQESDIYDLFVNVQQFEEDNCFFQAGVQAVLGSGQLSKAEVDTVLDYAQI